MLRPYNSAPPTYVEASDYDYSSDEGEGELFGGPEPKQMQQQQAATQDGDSAQEENLEVQPLKVNGAKKDGQTDGEARGSSEDSAKRSDDRERGSEDAVDRPFGPQSLSEWHAPQHRLFLQRRKYRDTQNHPHSQLASRRL